MQKKKESRLIIILIFLKNDTSKDRPCFSKYGLETTSADSATKETAMMLHIVGRWSDRVDTPKGQRERYQSPLMIA
jgi:hypothetical protein